MLSLTDTPLSAIKFDDRIYHVNLAFDTVIKYLELAESDEPDQEEKAIGLFFGDQELPLDPDFFESSFKLINETITKAPYQSNSSMNFGMQVAPQQLYSYRQDADAIYASFLMQYHIDLLKERGKMHWCVFRALFDGLNEDTPIQRIIDLRQKSSVTLSSSCPTPSGVSPLSVNTTFEPASIFTLGTGTMTNLALASPSSFS